MLTLIISPLAFFIGFALGVAFALSRTGLEIIDVTDPYPHLRIGWCPYCHITRKARGNTGRCATCDAPLLIDSGAH